MLTKSSADSLGSIYKSAWSISTPSTGKVLGAALGSVTSPETSRLKSAAQSTAILKPNHIWAGSVYGE